MELKEFKYFHLKECSQVKLNGSFFGAIRAHKYGRFRVIQIQTMIKKVWVVLNNQE